MVVRVDEVEAVLMGIIRIAAVAWFCRRFAGAAIIHTGRGEEGIVIRGN